MASKSRTAALLTLLDVAAGKYPETGLDQHGSDLTPLDRSLAATLVYGVLRWRSKLDWIITVFLKKPTRPLAPIVRYILEISLYQLLYLDRVPPSAAVNEAVKLAKLYGPHHAPPLVNAILRAVTRANKLPDPVEAGLPPVEALALSQAHPLWLTTKWTDELGLDETAALLEANNLLPPLCLRANTDRVSRSELMLVLEKAGLTVRAATFSPVGLNLKGPTGPVESLPGFREGLFTIQDEITQIVPLLAQARPGELILDACTGRGSKALHLAELIGGPVYGLDPNRERLLAARLESIRLGRPLLLVQGDLLGHPFPDQAFDLVLVDAPCSNLGVIRRRPDIKWSKSAEDPARLAHLQKRLLAAATRLVKPGGRLIYSVCTMTQEETQDVMTVFLEEFPEFELLPVGELLPGSAQSLVTSDGRLMAWPHRHRTDGFFAAAFRKHI